ncbi:hypothetical protein AMJ57_05170 [Parcubacteria bacterium SG8_24]|nr:MAG: hypothetical protein AMJ57_05170 [Parcubacteria bacterium SG8_24]
MQVTLNLLAPDKKKVLKTQFVLAFVQSKLAVLFIVTIFITGTILGLRGLLVGVKEDLMERSQVESSEYNSVALQISSINDYITRAEAVMGQFVDWQAVTESITASMPKGTVLDTIQVDAAHSIYIRGQALTRDDVLIIRDRLESLPHFTEIRAPLSNILKQYDVPFEFQLKYVAPANQEGV